jgi:hypothetical protein
MVRTPLVLTTIVLGIGAHSTTAAADAWSLHILANAQLGWTDNLQSATSETSVPPKEAEVYGQVAPGLLLTWATARSINELSASFESNLYALHDEGSSYLWRGGWRGFFMTSPLSELEGSLKASGGTFNSFTTSSAAANGQVQLIGSAASTYLSLDATEGYSRQLSRPLRLTQSALTSVFSTTPDDPMAETTTGFRVGGGLGLDRAWHYNGVGARASASYDGLGGGKTQLTLSGSLLWRRDISRRWASVVDVGAVTLVSLAGSDVGPRLEPTIGAQIGYYPTWGAAGLSVRRTVTPNLIIAANTISDTAVLNATLPLTFLPLDVNHTPRYVFSASGGYAFSSVVDSDTGETTSGFQAGLATAEVAYAIKPRVNIALRYQYEHQVAGEGSTLTNVRDYDRNTVLLTFFGRWPDRVAGEVPIRQSLRVDRSDVTPVGDEITKPGTTPEPLR